MAETKRAQRRKRVLINRLARKAWHRARRMEKFLSMHKIVIPVHDEFGWAWSEENDCLVDRGGPVALQNGWHLRSIQYERDALSDERLSELRKCLENFTDTRPPVIRVWPKNIVKLNWSQEFAEWDAIKHRVID